MSDGYCDEHKHIAEERKKERHKRYDSMKRDKQAASFYKSTPWERVRLHALDRDHHLCQHCVDNKRIQMADMIDHIIPIRIDWSLRVTMSNLQSLCNQCHAIKTAEDKRKYGDKL